MTDSCPECGGDYAQLGQHWAKSGCDYPSLSDHQREVVAGLLMGDAHLDTGSRSDKARLTVRMTNEEYLRHLKEVFGPLATDVSLYRTAAEQAERYGNGSGEWQDVYDVSLRSHPELSEFESWYTDGKIWPEIGLTPTILKHYYVCDGHYDGTAINLALWNERTEQEKVQSMFTEAGLPSGTWIDSTTSCEIRFSEVETGEIFTFLGEPLPGFERKWP